MEFKNLGVHDALLKAINDQHYDTPTPIQKQAIPPTLEGRDVLGLAQTGTGKTAAFAVPTLQNLSLKKNQKQKRVIRSLVLTPTRELAIQIQESFESYGRYLPLKSTVIFGGVGQGKQVTMLRSGVDILVATPGRLKDLVNQGYVNLASIEIFILDEADRMLDMGFINDVRQIIKLLPLKKQTLLFSATMPKEITQIVDQLLVDPVRISITPVSSAVDTVEQSVYFVDRNHKIDLLADLFKKERLDSVLIFTRTKHGANNVVKNLEKRKIKAKAIHGNKSQNARQDALEKFKSKQTQVLVATDIASRGIDIHDLKCVVNYDLPEVPETYVHRIGRTGRAGLSGMAISLCAHQDKPLLRDIEKLIRQKINVLTYDKYPMVDFSEKAPQQQRKQANAKKSVVDKEKKATADKNFKRKPKNRKNTRSNWSKQNARTKS